MSIRCFQLVLKALLMMYFKAKTLFAKEFLSFFTPQWFMEA